MNLELDTPESHAWQENQNELAVAHLDSLTGRDQLGKQVTANLTDTRLAPVLRRGARWFQLTVLDPTDDHPVVVVRDSPTGAPRVLVDPNALSASRGAPTTLMLYVPSPDGTVLAYSVMVAGAEVMELHLVDVASGEELHHSVPWNVNNFVWLADSSGLVIGARDEVGGVFANPVYVYVLGAEPGPALDVPEAITDARPVVSANGRHIALATGNTEPRLDWIVKGDALEPLLLGLPGGAAGAFHGDDLIALVDHDAPRGRLVRIPIATAGDTTTWIELLAESEEVLRSVDVVGDEIVLGYLRDATCGLRLLDRDGVLVEEISLPSAGTVSAWPYNASHPALPMFVTGTDEVSFIHSSLESSWAVYRYVVSERRLEVVTPSAVTLEGLVISRIWATSSDGTSVPAHVVHHSDVDPTVPQPTLLYGYGGFNMAYLPGFLAEQAAWVQAGGVFVLGHLRGGSDFGSEWWLQGRRDRKQQTFDDLYAIAEHLIGSGLTTRTQLAMKGESNGGLLAGAAIVQRPDLWAGVVADVPILDLLGFARDPYTYVIGKDEYGDPTIPAEAEWLRAVSPVHNVKPAAYPPVLLTAGANDPRCPAWHARVFADLVQQNQTGDAPVLLRVYSDQGHNASGLGEVSSKGADWLAFLADATGLGL